MKLNRRLLRKMILSEIKQINEAKPVMGSLTSAALSRVPSELLSMLRNKISMSPIKKVVGSFGEFYLKDPLGYEYHNKGQPTPAIARELSDLQLRIDSDDEGGNPASGYVKIPGSLNEGNESYRAIKNANYNGQYLKIYNGQFADVILIDDETAALFNQVAMYLRQSVM